jgi:hypothetical protein
MNDLSFIRLEPNFNDAKYLRASTAAKIFYNGQIILCPNQTYLQTTNCPLGIAFDGNYKVTIVDCNDNELQDITSRVAINERTINGVQQIDFEIVKIGVDYFAKNVYLKFTHTVSNYVWYSNPLQITNYFDDISSRFNYKNANDTYYQSITLKCFFSVNDAESNSNEYVTYEGKKITSRLITTELEQYFFDNIDNFTFRRLNNLLSRNIVYINGNRITNKQTLASKARAGDTNIFSLDFKVAIDYNDIFVEKLQIFDPLELITLYPKGNYTLASLNYVLQGEFNRIVTLNTGTIKLFKDNVLFYTFTEEDISLTDNTFEIDLTGILTSNGVYYVNISNGLFTSVLEEVYQGITNTTDWLFSIGNGEYEVLQYSNEYLIN